jgi:hypothetical protein
MLQKMLVFTVFVYIFPMQAYTQTQPAKQAQQSQQPSPPVPQSPVEKQDGGKFNPVDQKHVPTDVRIVSAPTKDRWDKAAIWINAVLAGIGLIGIGVGVGTLLTIKRQADIMEIQAKDARDSAAQTFAILKEQTDNLLISAKAATVSAMAADESAKAAHAQIQMMQDRERCRLSIEPLPLTALYTEVQWQKIEFSIANFGATLAMRVRVISNCLLAGNDGSPDREGFEGAPPQIGNSDALEEHVAGGHHDACWIQVVRPSDQAKVTVPLFWYPQIEDVERIYSVYIHVWGRVDYDDIFGNHHFFRYRFRFHLLRLGHLCEGMDGVARFPIDSVIKWSGYQDEEESSDPN